MRERHRQPQPFFPALLDAATQFLLVLCALGIACLAEELHPSSFLAIATVTSVELGGLLTAIIISAALVARAAACALYESEKVAHRLALLWRRFRKNPHGGGPFRRP
jgi:hypothetical protein